jgi:hemoglobin
MSDAENALLDRLGGPEGMAKIVTEMYRRVLADAELSHFFQGVSMERLHRMQYEFIVSAFGGPIAYTGAELTGVHRGRGITSKHFARFCGHFADAMEAYGSTSTDVHQALGRLAMYKDKITGDTNVDG